VPPITFWPSTPGIPSMPSIQQELAVNVPPYGEYCCNLPSKNPFKKFPDLDADPDHQQNHHRPISNFPRKFHANPFITFCAKVLRNKQTNADKT